MTIKIDNKNNEINILKVRNAELDKQLRKIESQINEKENPGASCITKCVYYS